MQTSLFQGERGKENRMMYSFFFWKVGGAGCMGSGMIDEKRPVFHPSQGEGETYKACLNYHGIHFSVPIQSPAIQTKQKQKRKKLPQ